MGSHLRSLAFRFVLLFVAISLISGAGLHVGEVPNSDPMVPAKSQTASQPGEKRQQAVAAPNTDSGSPEQAGTGSSSSGSRVDVFIGFHQPPGSSDEDFVRREGGRIEYTYTLVRAIAASIPTQSIDRIRNNPRVRYIEEDTTASIADHTGEVDAVWGVKRIGSGVVHHDLNHGTGVRVGVLDSGIVTHADLAHNPSCSYNFVAKTPAVHDGHGHGTHVAGSVGALKNGLGVVGVAPSVTLCVYKVLSDAGSGSYSDIVAAVERSVKDGVKITNNSYGSSGDPGITVRDAFDKAQAQGVLHIGAAGNAGNAAGNGSNCIFPARYGSVVAVAATTSSDARASFSSTCSELELAAPGSQIYSTTRNGGWGTMSGTSMASPHAAGVAALVGAANPSWSTGQIRERLHQTAQDLGPTGRDTRFGFGLVRADSAAGGGGNSEPTTGSISGVIRSAEGAVLSGASVQLDTGGTATSASDGTYSFSAVPVGTRSLTASAEGFEPLTRTASVTGGQNTIVDFSLNPAGAPPPQPTASVASISYSTSGGKDGKRHLQVAVAVVDGSGNPVGGASISVDVLRSGSVVWSGTGTTGSDGRATFSLTNAPNGCYTTTVRNVSASGFAWDGSSPDNGPYCK